MPIDWFTVSAQILNFLILLWLLKRFLYKPILLAVQKREELIEMQLNDASETKAKAEAQKNLYEKMYTEFSQKREDLLKSTDEECRNQRARTLHETREEYEKLSLDLKKKIIREHEELFQSISLNAQKEIFSITRKTLRDLASAELENLAVHKFLNNFKNLSEKDKSFFLKSENLFLRTAFELSEEQRGFIQTKLCEFFSSNLTFKYTVMPDRVCGIELIADDHKIGWSIAEYLDSLQASFIQVSEQK